MGYIKETADVVKDSLKGISNKKKFKKLVDNMVFAIETNTVSEYFLQKFRFLEELAPMIDIIQGTIDNIHTVLPSICQGVPLGVDIETGFRWGSMEKLAA